MHRISLQLCVLSLFSSLLLSGCSGQEGIQQQTSEQISTQLAQVGLDPKESEAHEAVPSQTSTDIKERKDLRTRKSGEDWSQFLGPRENSTSTETGILSPWPEAGLPLEWQVETGEGYSAPVTSKGRLFLFSRVGREITLHCYQSETGVELWDFKYPTDYRDQYGYDGGPRCSPVVDEDRLYLYGPEGMLYCISVMEGKEIWRVNTMEDYGVIQNFFGVGSTPVIEGDLLLVQVGGSPPGSENASFSRLEGNGTGIVAFDKMTGKERYYVSKELASYASPVLATMHERRWCFVFARGGLVAFNPSNGKLDFEYPWRARILESVNASNPVVVGNEVFISETYGPGSSLIRVLENGSYEVVWSDADKGRNKSFEAHWNTPIYHDGYLYGCTGRHSSTAELRCIEWETGEVQWSEGGLDRCSLLKVDGHFVCLGEYGTLRLLKINSKQYEEVSVFTPKDEGAARFPGVQAPGLLKYPAWAAPVLSHGLLYCRGKGVLACFELIPESP
ncbi:Outer membrane protein assembly factor BamB [Planctomycetales bacterium 10988]|nr:Outer membrane protein assembly factor BamB [Planctomycetales bacterium 10988]